ncbi:MAG: zinc-ribbon domain-containing protein [Methylophilaceae bacterium]|nr:MAG: zinc-ribbon domain-containing protein [Methylophilaceae bacterium]
MKYVTACPNCGTQFLLDDTLIQAHRGKVQCGHCDHVFNAKNRLTEVTDENGSTEDYPASVSEADVESAHALTTEGEIATEHKQENTDELTQSHSLIEQPDTTASDVISSSDVDYYISSPNDEAELDSKLASQAEIQEPAVNVDTIFLSTRPANKPSQYSSLIKLICFLLIILAAIQATYFLRHAVARQFPVIKPLLERACIPLKCTIDLSKHLDLISIGDSDMQEDDTYQSVIKFSSSITNNAHYPQAYPNIELTLTDSDDRAVIKKLITPKNYLSSIDNIKNGLAPQETAALTLLLHVADPSVASYRILLFY